MAVVASLKRQTPSAEPSSANQEHISLEMSWKQKHKAFGIIIQSMKMENMFKPLRADVNLMFAELLNLVGEHCRENLTILYDVIWRQR